MNEKEMILFDSLIAEYELRAKYNNDQRDYEMYSMLVNARGVLTQSVPESDKLQKIEARLKEWESTRANMCDADFECIGDIKLILKGESEDAIHNHNN